MKRGLVLASLWLAAGLSQAVAQEAATPDAFKLVAEFDRPGLNVPHWQVMLPVHGLAQYTGVPVKGNDPGTVLFPITGAGRAKLAAWIVRSKGMQPCETKSKGIANMGAKTLEFTPADGAAQRCTYNYTDNKPLAEAFEYLQSMVDTLQAGVELERLHRYDRLGLDAVMSRLADDAKAGKAAELGSIRSTLESLVSDPLVLERVRSRAQQLLELAKQQDADTP